MGCNGWVVTDAGPYLELLFRRVFAFPNVSRMGLAARIFFSTPVVDPDTSDRNCILLKLK
jgi:hypothetical protein